MAGKKRKGSGTADRIGAIIVGAILVIGSLIPVSVNLFGRTGHVTEITHVERVGGRLDEPGRPNAYWWTVGYKFKMANGEFETGSIQVKGDAISSKSGLRIGSPVRYLVFIPAYNTPGEGTLGGSTIMFPLTAAFGVWMITLGVRKGKPPKTPAQRSREYREAKAAREAPESSARTDATVQSTPPPHAALCESCGARLGTGAGFCSGCGAPVERPMT